MLTRSQYGWAIVSKFDPPWFEPHLRPVRSMSLESTSKKFDSRKYIAQQNQAKLT